MSRSVFRCSGLVAEVLFLFFAGAAGASDEDPFALEQGVSSATFRSQPLSEVPASVTIVTAEDIRDFGFRTLAEVLASVRGFFISSDHNYAYPGLRGFGPLGDWGSRVLVMLDGHPLVGSVYRDSPLDREFPLDMSSVERIEVVRGPGSTLYGTNAVLGVVNVVSRRNPAGKGPETALRASTDQKASGSLSWGGQDAGWKWNLAGGAYGGRGPNLYLPEFDVPAVSDGWARGADGEAGFSFMASAERHGWTVRAATSQRVKEIPTAAYGTVFDDDRTLTRDRWSLVSLEHFRVLGVHSAIQGRFSLRRAWYEGDYLYEGEEGDVSLLRDGSDGAVAGLDVRALLQPMTPLRLAFGAENQRHFEADQKIWDVYPGEPTREINRPFWNNAVYGHAEVALRSGLSASLGTRVERESHYGTVANPRLGVVWQADDRTTLKTLAGRSFRGPNVYELFYSDEATTKGNPDLRPEVLWAHEWSIERRLGYGLSISALAFHNSLDDWIGNVTDPEDSLIVYRNNGSLVVNGGELELTGRRPGGVRWSLSYMYAHPEGRSEAPNFARHVGQASLVIPLPPADGRLAFLFRAVGPRRTGTGERVPGYGIADVTLGGEPAPGRVRATLSIRNIMDQPWADPGGEEHVSSRLPREGRRAELGLAFSF